MKRGQLSLVIIASGIFLSACSQEAPVSTEPLIETGTLQTEQIEAPAPSVQIPIKNTPPSSKAAIRRVEGLMISRPSDQPEAVVIFASGVVDTDGWTEPRLVPINPDETIGTLSFNFVATSPGREIPTRIARPIEARLDIEEFPLGVDIVRIVSASNELTAFVGN